MRAIDLAHKSYDLLGGAVGSSQAIARIEVNASKPKQALTDDLADVFERAAGSTAAPTAAAYANLAKAEQDVETAAKQEQSDRPGWTTAKIVVACFSWLLIPLLIWPFMDNKPETDQHKKDLADVDEKKSGLRNAIGGLIDTMEKTHELREPPVDLNAVSGPL